MPRGVSLRGTQRLLHLGPAQKAWAACRPPARARGAGRAFPRGRIDRRRGEPCIPTHAHHC